MQLVNTALLHPGQCAIIPSGHGPFVDTLRVDAEGRRVYVSLEAFNELARVYREAGASMPAEVSRAARVLQLETELAAERAEHEKLKASVRFTLEAGRGAVQKKDGSNQLRNLPGQKAVRV